jgi:hypothetical protein
MKLGHTLTLWILLFPKAQELDHKTNDMIIKKIRFIHSLILIYTYFATNGPHHSISAPYSPKIK